MGFLLATQIVNGVTYIVGADQSPTGSALPSIFKTDANGIPIFFDEYGNPLVIQNADGSLSLANIAPTAAQITARKVQAITPQIAGIIVAALTSSPTAVGSWAAVDAAIRAALAGVT
jgi:hypothetical protein